MNVRLPKVSVVMGVHNGAGELAPTLESVLEQEGVDFEVIVVDDGSSDASGNYLDAMAKSDTRIHVLHQENRGLTQALIRGCRVARGDYIARQDCGDRSYPSRLTMLSERLDRNRNLVMVSSAYRHVGPKGELLQFVSSGDNHGDLRRVLRSGDPAKLYGPHHGTVMFRRAAYFAAGGYRPEFYFAQDLDLWTRMACIGDIEYLEDILYEVKFLYGSITATQRARQTKRRELIAEATRLRSMGESDHEVLKRASQVRPSSDRPSTETEADSDYFIGSCLALRRDPAARAYLFRAIKRRPWMSRAWAKLMMAVLWRR